MALAIYLLLSSPSLGNLLFYYPELHFFTVVALILMGRYTGYRLTELVRFRDLVHPPENPTGIAACRNLLHGDSGPGRAS